MCVHHKSLRTSKCQKELIYNIVNFKRFLKTVSMAHFNSRFINGIDNEPKAVLFRSYNSNNNKNNNFVKLLFARLQQTREHALQISKSSLVQLLNEAYVLLNTFYISTRLWQKEWWKMHNYREQLYKKHNISSVLGLLKWFIITCLFPDEEFLSHKS